MSKGDLISIIITTHGRSDKIEGAIKSALEQTYENIEVIVVDDNADDLSNREDTERIVGKYSEVKLIQNEKTLGGGKSRNVGINAARGKLISFLDDDDLYLPERVERLYELYRKHIKDDIGLAYCSCDAVDGEGRIINEYVNVANGHPFYQQMIGCIAGTSMWLVPKVVLKKINGFDDVPSKQDSTVIMKMLVAGYNVFGIQDKLVLYLEHCGNGISGVKMSNAEGIKLYREKCREQYWRLSEDEVKEVECNFSGQLIVIYLVNDDLTMAKTELNNIGKHKPFSKMYCKNLLKIIFRRWYIKKYSVR